MKLKKILKSLTKIALILLFLIVFLLTSLYFGLRSPKIQTWIAKITTKQLSKQLGLPVDLGRLEIDFFNTVNIENIYIEDLNADTLAFIEGVHAKLSYFSLLQKTINLDRVEVSNFYLNIERPHNDSLFNIDAIQLPQASSKLLKEKTSDPWEISMDNVLLKDIWINYLDYYAGNTLVAQVDETLVSFNYMKFGDMNFELERMDVNCPSVHYRKLPPNPNFVKIEQPMLLSLPFNLNSNTLNLNHGQFTMDMDGDSSLISNRIDSKHLALSEINLHTNSLLITGDSLYTNIHGLSFDEKSGFSLSNLQQKLIINNEALEFRDLKLNTDNSQLESDVVFRYAGFDGFKNFTEDVRFDIQMAPSLIHSTDLAYFVDPTLYKFNYPINIQGNIYGKISSFNSKNLKIRSGKYSLFEGSFSMNGLPDIKQTFISGKVDRLITDYSDVLGLYPGIPLPKNIDKLGRLFFKGKFDGFINDFVTQGYLKSELGSINTDLNFKLDNKQNASYSGTFDLQQFSLGKYFGIEEALGEISLKGSGKGKGLKLKTLDIEVSAVVEQIDIKGYSYENVLVDGRVKDNFFNGKMSINDENIALNFNGQIDATQEIPVFKFDAEVDRVDLKALNLWKEQLIVSAKINSDFSASSINDVIGYVNINDLLVSGDKKNYDIGYVNATSRQLSNGEKQFSILSQDIDASVQGEFEFGEIPNTFRSVLIPNFEGSVGEQLIKFELDIKDNPDLLSLFVPDLKILRPSRIDGNINSDTKSMLAVVNLPVVQYKDFSALDVNSTIYVDDGAFDVISSIPSFYMKDSLFIKDFSVLVNGPRDELSLKLFADGAQNSSLELFANLITKDEGVTLEFDPSNIYLNDQFWMIDKDNEILIGDCISSKNLKLYNGMSELLVDLEIGAKEKKADIFLSNIFIEDFTQFLALKDIDLNGIANGRVSVDLSDDSPGFYGDLMVENIEVNDYQIGNLNASAILDLPNKKVKLNGNLYGEDNEVDINGTYSFAKEITKNDFDLNFDIKNFAIYSIEDFIPLYIDNTQGTVSGSLSLVGPRNKPDLLGYLDINDVTTTVTFLKTSYNVKNQRVLFDKKGINLGDKLKITDMEGNIAYGKGRVYHTNLKDFGLDIDVVSDKVMGLNTTLEDNQDFYGTAYLKGSAAFKGRTNDVTISIKGESEGKSDISIPLTESGNASTYEFYTFVEKKKEETEFLINRDDELKVKGVTVNLDLDMDNDCKVKIILDQTTGDVLEVKGEGNVKINVPKEGDVMFYGSYVISDGEYLFTLQNIINKRFRIEPNSNINFQGRIEDTQVDVDAVYNLRAAPKDLIEDFLVITTNDQLKGEALNRVPVKLLLSLTGILYNPDIAFDIAIEQLNPTLRNYVDRKIFTLKQYENEMNRQVFGLLVLNQFLPPLSSIDQVTNGGFNINASDAANTVSEFVSNQLTRYFNDWISYLSDDVSLNFNYRNYEQDLTNLTSIEDLSLRRELQLALTTRFLNDRVTVNVGGNVDFGANQLGVDNSSTTYFGGNASIEYALTENRRFRIKAFTNTDYDYFNQANTTRAGVGLSFKREFDNVKDLKIKKEEFKLKEAKSDSTESK